MDEFERVQYLLDEDVYRSNRKKAEDKAGEISSEDWTRIRIRCKKDLFFLAYSILGYDKLSPHLHGHLCTFVKNTEHERFREFLLPRGHYKSTVLTIAHSIQCALPDDAGDSPWPLNLGPNIRLLLGHEVDGQAQRFLASITGHFLGNQLLMALFPECVPNKSQHRINKSELELPRKSIWSEPTFDTMGVGGRSQGRHYNYLKLDDLIGDKARDSKVEMASTKDWFDNIQSFFSAFKADKLDLIGTRWSHDDLYAHAHEVYGIKDLSGKKDKESQGNLVTYIRKVEEVNPETKKKEPIFPEEFTTESLATIRKKPKVWNAQYLNDPFEGVGGFNSDWLRYYYWKDAGTLVYYEALTKVRQEVKVTELNKYILIDPAMEGLAGFLVTGVDKKGKIFILEALKDEWKPPKLVELIFQKVIRWQPRCVAIEKVLFSGLFAHWIISLQQQKKIRFKVEPLVTRGQEKEARILGLSNYFEAGQILINEKQTDFKEEYDRFGFTENIHMLDALAHGPQVWRNFSGIIHEGSQVNSSVSKIDKLTGYSPIVRSVK